jgi:hypothetical protein
MQAISETSIRAPRNTPRKRTTEDRLYYVKLQDEVKDDEGTTKRVSQGEIVRYVDYRKVFVRPGDRDDAMPRFGYIKDAYDYGCAVVGAYPGVWDQQAKLFAEPYEPTHTFQADRWSQVARMRAAGRNPVEWQHLIPMHGRPVSQLPVTQATFVVLRGKTVFHVEIIAKR